MFSAVAAVSVLPGNQGDVAKTEPTYSEVFIPAQTRTIEPRDYLRELAGPDFELLDRIVWCESGWKPTAQNQHSTAGGLFQFLDSTWARYSNPQMEKYNPYDNIRAGIALYKKEGTAPWNSSRSCWNVKRQ